MKEPSRKKPKKDGESSKKSEKLQALPQGSKIIKRPLGHRIGLPPSRTVYVSSRAPFMSLVKRVRKKLEHDAGRARLPSTKGLPLLSQLDNLNVRGAIASSSALSSGTVPASVDPEKQEVKVLATGKAIPKAIEVAAWFQRQPDCFISIKSGSLPTVDEVEHPIGRVLGTARTEKDDEGDVEMELDCEESEEFDSSRTRYLTYVEVGVKYRV